MKAGHEGRREAAVAALMAALLAQGGGLEVAEVVVVAVSGAAGLFIGEERQWRRGAVAGDRQAWQAINGRGGGSATCRHLLAVRWR